MAMTRKDFALTASCVVNTLPWATVDASHVYTARELRVAHMQHKKLAWKLAREYDAAYLQFNITKFMNMCGYDNVKGDFVLRECYRVESCRA